MNTLGRTSSYFRKLWKTPLYSYLRKRLIEPFMLSSYLCRIRSYLNQIWSEPGKFICESFKYKYLGPKHDSSDWLHTKLLHTQMATKVTGSNLAGSNEMLWSKCLSQAWPFWYCCCGFLTSYPPASKVSRVVFWNQAQKNFTHPTFSCFPVT